MAPSVTGEGAESQVRVWPDKLSVCAPLLGRGGQEVGERCSSCTKDREQAAVLLCFWRTVRERSRCVCGGHQGTKDDMLRVRGRPGGDMLVALPSGDRWIVVAGLADRVRSGQVRSLQVSDQQATNPRCHQTPRLDHAVLACASRWTWTDQDPSRDSASGSQKATLRLTNEPLGDSSPRHLVPSIRPHGRRTHLSYMTSRNALRHVLARLARTTPSPSARRSPRTSESI